MKKIKIYDITEQIEAMEKTHLSYGVGIIHDIKYYELVQILGKPTFSLASSDEKVQKEWVIEYGDDIYTIYDWKTYDEEYTMSELYQWNVGGTRTAVELIQYIQDEKNKSLYRRKENA